MMKNGRILFALAVSVAFFARAGWGQQRGAKDSGKASAPAPTVEEAQKFIESAEKELFDLGLKAQRAGWVQENFITEDTEQMAADAGEAFNTAGAKYAKEAHRFD